MDTKNGGDLHRHPPPKELLTIKNLMNEKIIL